jgi:aspartyl-tRNA(Asn)/glutamyl-tRNA(Gln) amidotransferase subunit A
MKTISDALNALREGRTTARALLEASREAAGAAASLNALAWVDWEQAALAADALDASRARGAAAGALHGIPVTVKDLFNVAGMPTRGGTHAPLHELGSAEASLATRLREADALIFAKTNLHEVALGATGENRWTGDVCNPFDPERQAGGSSSGAAVAVASGIGLGAVGSDTGGSIRIPAAFCGVVGFKPTYGAIPLDGGLNLSWTCDHAGPLARSVDDCALLYEVMSGRSTRHGAVPRTPRLAIPASWLRGRLQPGVREVFERLVAALRSDGVTVMEIDAPLIPRGWDAYTPLVRAEAAWVHRRALADGGEGFSELVAPPLRAGLSVPASDYIASLKVRESLIVQLESVLTDYDALIMPGNAVLPPKRGQTEVSTEGGTMSVRDAVLGQTAPFSFAGLPALVLPTGLVEGLPTSLQLVARRDADASLLALARWFEARLSTEAA